MKIIIASPLYPPEIGGPATYTKELAQRLCDQHECTVIAYTNNNKPFPGTRLVPIAKNLSMPVRLFKYFLALLREAGAADVIYVQNAVAAGLPAMLVGKIRSTPVILKFVGDEAWERAMQHKKTKKRLVEFLKSPDGGFKIKLIQFVQKLTLRNVAIVTTPSQYLGEIIGEAYRIPKSKIQTNYNAAENITEAPFEVDKKPHQLAVTARLVAWKGVSGIIKAVAILKRNYPDIHLVVAGDGPERESLEALTQELDLSKEVSFLGNVSRSETWHIRKESELYILNSTYEGLPHTALTSFAAKIPMVATDIPGTNEAVYDEKSGLLVEAENHEQLAKTIERLFEDKDLQKQIVEGGSEILKKKFSWETHLANLLSFFETVLRKPGQ